MSKKLKTGPGSKLPWVFHEADDKYCIVSSENSIVLNGYKTEKTKKDFQFIIRQVNSKQ